MESASLAASLDNVLQVRLKERHDPILQLGEFFEVAFAAEYIVANLCQASSGGETDIACAND
jgi:hypothetical protein